MLNTCSTGTKEAASAKYFLARMESAWKWASASSETEVCSWFLPVLVPPSRQLSQMTGERYVCNGCVLKVKSNFFSKMDFGFHLNCLESVVALVFCTSSAVSCLTFLASSPDVKASKLEV